MKRAIEITIRKFFRHSQLILLFELMHVYSGHYVQWP